MAGGGPAMLCRERDEVENGLGGEGWCENAEGGRAFC